METNVSFCQQLIAVLAALVCGAPAQPTVESFIAAQDPPRRDVITQQAPPRATPVRQFQAAHRGGFDQAPVPSAGIVRAVIHNPIRDAQTVRAVANQSTQPVARDIVRAPNGFRAVVAEGGPSAMPRAIQGDVKRVTTAPRARNEILRPVDHTSPLVDSLVRAQGTVRRAAMHGERFVREVTDPQSAVTVRDALRAVPRTIARGCDETAPEERTGVGTTRRTIRDAIGADQSSEGTRPGRHAKPEA